MFYLNKFLELNSSKVKLMDVNFELMDIGAKGGIPKEFYELLPYNSEIICFEPNIEEFEKLAKEKNFHKKKFLNYAIALSNNRRKFYLTNYSSACSLYKMKDSFKRFHDSKNLRVISEIIVDCVSLDYLLEKKEIKVPNFIKIDVEGAELEILEGSEKILSDINCLGIKVEIRFDKFLENSDNIENPLFSDVDNYLRKFGFKLYDLKTSTAGKFPLNQPYSLYDGKNMVPGPSIYGQIIGGDALYFKDPMADENKLILDDEKNILRMIKLFSVHNQIDSAIELASFLKNNNDDYSEILNYFKLDFYGKKIDYQISQEFINKHNMNNDLLYWSKKEYFYKFSNYLFNYVKLLFPSKIKNIVRKKLL